MSIALPGAVILVNNDLSPSVLNRLQIQLHISETISGQTFDLRLAAEPNYVQAVRGMRQRLLVMRDFRERENRTVFDVVIYIKESMVYIEGNCFGPTGASFALSNLQWAQLGIYDTDLNRTCATCGECNCGGRCGCSVMTCGCGTPTCDGYGRGPYYPARFDPMFPRENHPYNQVWSRSIFGGYGCNQNPDRVLCSEYYCDTHGNVIPMKNCRCVKQ